ncbi:16471_t:CDS:10 [Funneliformis caledonium]|uniref:protein-serine/threonine phosphatase n=1 Tax=Funneliformis caledonium TaxID=1117310 RepID=A0A9N8YY49_9GLOM|nr:16471_t:CDS:10 [Funneliformis caledonium]
MDTCTKYFKFFVAGASFVCSFQCNLLYLANYPEGSRECVPTPSEYDMPYQEVTLSTSDKIKIRIYVIQQGNDTEARKRPTILFCHGNAGNMGLCLPITERLYDNDDFRCNIVMLSYRGYGFSEGSPSEKGLKIDAQTALDFIMKHEVFKHTKVVVYGQSLGGAVSIDLVSKNEDKVSGLIVENTFLSIPKVVPHVIPQLRHFSFFCTQKWDSEKAIQNIKRIPILFLSGANDDLIPKEHVNKLYELAETEGGKIIKSFPYGTHADTVAQPGYFESIVGRNFAVVCASNQNRSMEAHHVLTKYGFKVKSYGTGSAVRLPGPSLDRPNIYPFGTPYDYMFKDLYEKDTKLYKQNGLLDMLDRNRKIKLAPEQWYTEANETFDVIITCEERCFDAICEDLTDRGEHKNKPVHVINIDIKDNHEDAMIGGRAILQLAQMIDNEQVADLDETVPGILQEWQEKYKYDLLHSVAMRLFDKSRTIVSEYLEQCVNKKEDDWGLIINTCNAVNASENGAKEAAKFIRKRLSKSVNVQHRTLTVLKSMVDNCGAKFHAEIASKKFLDDLELVATSQSTDDVIKNKIISLLSDLTEMFQNEPSLYQISNLYTRLTGLSGVQTPVQTPVQATRPVSYPIQKTNISHDVSAKAKITEDIEVSKNNVQLFTQTLSFTDPESEDITKNELIQEFYTKCKSLHQNIMSYISEIQDEQWMNTLLSVNQDFLNSFKMYEDMVERGQVKIAKQESQRQSFRGSYHLDLEGAGVGGSSSRDPFADPNEAEYDPIVSGPSAKALGKMPASKFYDSAQNYNTSNNHSPLYNEFPNRTSIYNDPPKLPASIYNDTTLFEEEQPASEVQPQYPNIVAPLEPSDYKPPNSSNNINGRQEHIII